MYRRNEKLISKKLIVGKMHRKKINGRKFHCKEILTQEKFIPMIFRKSFVLKIHAISANSRYLNIPLPERSENQ